jgi:hypothetical protein
MPSAERTFSPTEAAVVSGVAVKTVHREIDEGPLKAKGKNSGKRTLRQEDLFYLAVAKGLHTSLFQLTSEGKHKLHSAIQLCWRKHRPTKWQLPLFGGGLALDLRGVLSDVRCKMALLEIALEN